MLDLHPHDFALLCQLVAEYLPPDTVVWAYGSRVNGDAHDGSDLDLVLRPAGLHQLPYATLVRFREALSESNLPILVDVHDWAQLPASFHERILARYEVLRPGASVAAST
jgi:predicted nucleotidyltransferase